jgi:NAD(P)-dependent dehydrogenase (short-subunit alcohol dehydrogenase family)
MSSTNKTWFITGTSSGFGRAFAEYAIECGHNFVASARNPDKLQGLVALAPERVLALRLDVTRRTEVDAAVAAAVHRFGRIDVLINNAGYGVIGAVEETPEAELRAIMETNFFGAMAVTQAALPQLRAQRSGAIVNISSLGGQLSFPGFSAYSASKFALEGASEALALEMAPFGVKVLIVEPGAFRTELVGDALRRMPAMAEYAGSVDGVRAQMHDMHGNQQGDPRKAAAAIEHALNAPVTPLRLQLGADAVDTVRGHAETLLRDLTAWQDVALATHFDAATT